MSSTPYDDTTRRGIHPISWEDYHGLCKALAAAAAGFRPEIIVPIGRGGYYPGTLIAHLLQVEVYAVRLSRRVNDGVQYDTPQWHQPPPDAVHGRRVLIVDEICSTGETLRLVRERVAALGASAIQTAVLYAHTWGVETPDLIGLISDALLLNPWDREVWRDGQFVFHPEYVAALGQQGLTPDPAWLIPATPYQLAKG